MQLAFGDYVLDAAKRELRRGADQIALEPQVFDVLLYLLQNRERVVTKDDLIAAVWNGRIVSESTLTSRITAARRAVGDSGARQEMIRTLARKGFRFVAPVTEGQDVAASEQDRHHSAAASSDHVAPAQHSADASHSTDGPKTPPLAAADQMPRQVSVLATEIVTPFRVGQRGTGALIREAEIVSDLVGDIYDAALDPALWVDALGKARAFVVGSAAALFWKDAASKRGAVQYTDGGIDPHYIQLYFDKYIKLDPSTTGLQLAAIEEPVATADLVPYDEFLATRFYREWAQPQGLVDCLNVVLEKSVTSVAVFNVFRHERDGVVDDETRRRMRLIVPHMRRAVLIGRTIDLGTAEAATFADALDGLAAGMFLLDADTRIVHANAAGHVMLAAGDVLRAAGSRLAANDPQTDQALRDIFIAAGNGDAALGVKGIAVPLTKRDGERFVAHVLPLTSAARRRVGAGYGAVAALFVHKAALDTPAAAPLPPADPDPVADQNRPAGSGAAAKWGGRPSVAVLPFANLSGDPEQEYFSDGITEDIITALSKYRSLMVIARNSSFAFKGADGDMRQAGLTFGSEYLVEGSVRKIGQRVRITTQLVETEGGRQLWAEQYDRDLQDLFTLQDEITTTIAARIEPEIGAAERLRVERKAVPALHAWDFFRLGTMHFYKSTAADNLEAQRLFRRAIELDPKLAEPHGYLSYAIVLSMVYFDTEPDEERLNEAVTIGRRGVELDDQDGLIRFMYGRALLARKSYGQALAELETAVELNPCLALSYCGLGDSLAYEGRISEAIPYFQKAIELSPYDPLRWAFYSYRALAHIFARQFEVACEWAQKATWVPNAHYWAFAHRVSALAHLERPEDLRVAADELLQRKPDFSCSFARKRLFYVKNPDQLELYIDGLRKAGIPE